MPKIQTAKRLLINLDQLGKLSHLEHLPDLVRIIEKTQADIAGRLNNIEVLSENLKNLPGILENILAGVELMKPHSVPVSQPTWPEIDPVIRFHVTPRHVVYDIGANKGRYTQLFASIAKEVHAFEPNPDMAAALRAMPLPANVTLHEIAMSAQSGEAVFHIDTRPGAGAVASSLMELHDLKATGMSRPVTVKTITLDEFAASASPPDFIKIDVEGYEPAVLEGGRRTIQTYKPTIVFEMWESHWDRYVECFKWLGETHYLVRVFDGSDAMEYYSNNTGSGGGDILAIPY